MKTKRLALLSLPLLVLLVAGCSGNGNENSSSLDASSSLPSTSDPSEPSSSESSSEETPEKIYNVEEAIALAQNSDTTNKEYLVRGIVKSFKTTITANAP